MSFNFNWIDLLMILLCGRIIYVGGQSNIAREGLRLIEIWVTTFITLHYYFRFALFLESAIKTPMWMNIQFSIILLWLSSYLVFKLIIDSWSLILKEKPKPNLDKWGGGIIAAIRAVFVCGLLYIALLASGNGTITKLTRHSAGALYLHSFSASIYGQCYNTMIKSYFAKEELNKELFKLLAGKTDKKSDGKK